MLILADDLGYGELGCYNGQEIPTPRIDSLASSGIRFTEAYVSAPYCATSRAGFLTGRYQSRFGFEKNPTGAANADPANGLPLSERTLADFLRDAGYATGLIGKWHLGGTAEYHPQRRGFDEFFGFLHEGHYYVPPPWEGATTWLRRKSLPDGGQGRWTSPDGRIIWSTHMGQREPDYDTDNPLLRSSQPVDERANLTEAFTREAESFIDRHTAQPFFLYVAYNAVHSPLQADDRRLRRFAHIEDIQRRIFAAMLAHLDESVGRILARLDAQNLSNDTMVIFLSDNGGPTRELTSSNHPLRGGKGQLYEGGVRVPMIVRWPDRLSAGQVESRPVISLDLLPTILAATNSPPASAHRVLDGVDLLPFLTDEKSNRPHEHFYWRLGTSSALRRGDWKIVRQRSRSKSVADFELYDLAKDIGETRNLAAEQSETMQQLIALWSKIDAQMPVIE